MLGAFSSSYVVAHVIGLFIGIAFGYTKLSNPYTGVLFVIARLLLGGLPFSSESRMLFAVVNSILWFVAWRFALITPIIATKKPK